MFETCRIIIEKVGTIFALHTIVRKDEKIIKILESIDGVVGPYYAEDYKIIFSIGQCFNSEKIKEEITKRIHEYLNNIQCLDENAHLFKILDESLSESCTNGYQWPKHCTNEPFKYSELEPNHVNYVNDAIREFKLLTQRFNQIKFTPFLSPINTREIHTASSSKFCVSLEYHTNSTNITRSTKIYVNAKNTIHAKEIALQQFPNAKNIVIENDNKE